MYIANELKTLKNKQYDEEIRASFMDILSIALEKIIEQKEIFDFDNFYAQYFDEFTLKTHCSDGVFNTVYLELNQPLNYKRTKILNKSTKNNKINFPELYYDISQLKDDLYDTLMVTLDNNNILWKDEYSVCVKSTINDDGEVFEYYFRIIPCISYYNKENIKGQMYRKNNGIEIEYVDLALENFNLKNEKTNNLYYQTILIFKNLLLKEKNITTLPKEIIETMLYNVPNEMFKNDKKETLINIINFIRNNSIKQFKTLDEQDLAFVSIYRSMSLLYVKHITKIIEKHLLSN